MKISWLKYSHPNKSPKYLLVLNLGIYNNKLCCIESDKLNKEEKEIIKSNSKKLNKMSAQDIFKEFKKICPEALRHYKTISVNNIKIEKEYEIKD